MRSRMKHSRGINMNGFTAQNSTEEAYTVLFHTGQGPYREERVLAGRPVHEPPAPDREGYDFTCWYRDETLTQEYDFSAPVSRNIRLYAGWERKSYYVRFLAGGLADPTTQEVVHGSTVIEPDVSFPGYVLEGWYTEETFQTRYDFNAKVTRNLLLYAKWKQR